MDYRTGAVYLDLPLLSMFYLCCKTSRSKLLRLAVHGLLLPLKPLSQSSISVLSTLTSSYFLMLLPRPHL